MFYNNATEKLQQQGVKFTTTLPIHKALEILTKRLL